MGFWTLGFGFRLLVSWFVIEFVVKGRILMVLCPTINSLSRLRGMGQGKGQGCRGLLIQLQGSASPSRLLGSRVHNSELRVQGLGLRCRVQGSGFRVFIRV